MSQNNSNTRLSNIVVGGFTVLAFVVLWGFFWKGAPKPASSSPEQAEPPRQAENTRDAESFVSVDTDVNVRENRRSKTDVEIDRSLKSFDRFGLPVVNNEGRLALFPTTGGDQRLVFMDIDVFKIWQSDPSRLEAKSRLFYLEPTFVVMRKDLEETVKNVSKGKDGKTELRLPISATHNVFKEAALQSVRRSLRAAGVRDADAVKRDNLITFPSVTNISLHVNGLDWIRVEVVSVKRDKYSFKLKFKDLNELNQFKTALENGDCDIKYDLHGCFVNSCRESSMLSRQKAVVAELEWTENDLTVASGFICVCEEKDGTTTFKSSRGTLKSTRSF